MKLSLTHLLAATLLLSCSPEKEETSSALATVDDAEITEEQFQYWWQRKGSRQDSESNRAALLDELIEREAMIQRAKKAGILDEQDLQEQFRSLVISRLKEKELNQDITIDDAELLALYEENKERFKSTAKSKIAVLWFQTRGMAPLAGQYRKRLEALLPTVETIPIEEGFGALSGKNTEHLQSRYQGGILGLLDPSIKYDPWRTAVLEIAAGLKPGQTSEIVTRKEGVFLVRLISQSEASPRTFDSVRPLLVKELRQTKRRELEQQFQESNLDDVQIERHLDRLNQLPLSSQKDANSTSSQ